jgi:hypothetical protein
MLMNSMTFFESKVRITFLKFSSFAACRSLRFMIEKGYSVELREVCL